MMIFLTQILPKKWNMWLNIIVALFAILFVIGGGSSTPHYIFVASVEVICALLIIRMAWSMKDTKT